MSVLIFGATGNVGRPLTAQLAKRDIDVVGVSRRPNRHRDSGISFRSVDVNDARALDAAISQHDKIVVIVANSPQQVVTEVAVIDAATRTGASQLVKVSVPGAAADSPVALGRDHFTIEEHLAATSLPTTIVRPGFFMQNLLHFAAWIGPDGSWPLPVGDALLAMVDARDVAEAIANIVTDDTHAGTDYFFTGAGAIDLPTAAATIADTTKRTVTHVDTSGDDFRARLLADGLDQRNADDLTILYDTVLRAGYGAATSDELATVLGREPASFADFAADHTASFVPEEGDKGPQAART